MDQEELRAKNRAKALAKLRAAEKEKGVQARSAKQEQVRRSNELEQVRLVTKPRMPEKEVRPVFVEVDPSKKIKDLTTLILSFAIVGSFVLIAFGADQESGYLIVSGIVSLKLWSLAACFFWVLFAIEKNTRQK